MTDNVEIYDTTLRDGEQAPGIHLSPEQKLRVARSLEEVGVDIIEAGFPINGETEKKAIKMIVREVDDSEVAVLCRPIPEEIEMCQELLSKAAHSRLHLWIATSPIHMKSKLRMTEDQVMKKLVNALRFSSGRFDTVQFTSEDSTRSNLKFLGKLMREAVRSGAEVVNVADTLGCAIPDHMSILVEHIRREIKDRVPVGVHCHNDLGLATANSLAAIRSGARHVDVTVTGIGERSGNAPLEQIAAILDFHQRHIGVQHNLKMDRLGNLCDVVIKEMRLDIEVFHPLIGKNSFRHESGIHVHGMLNNPMTYEFLNPEQFGIKGGEFVIGKHTGKAAVRHFLEKNDLVVDDEELGRLTEMIKERTTYKGPFNSEKELIDFASLSGFDLIDKGGFGK